MEKKLTCIGCPLGCTVKVEMENGSILGVSGNTCPRGETYARKEVISPERIVTSTVRITGGELPVAPVKTKTTIPKDKMFDCMKALRKVRLTAPVRIGDVALADAAGTGVDVIVTKNIEKM